MENQMPTFSQTEMLNELATIFLFEADHIVLGSGDSMGTQFIGFEAEDGEYCHMDPTRVSLDRFNIAGSFRSAYDYAYMPSVLNSLGEHEIQNLDVFMQGVPRVGGVSSGGETHKFMTSDGLCQCVTDTVHARWKLEWDSAGAGSHEFTTRELALLANMTDGAVRNALADKTEAGIRAISGTKNPVKISHAEALRWLSSRRGFVPGPKNIAEDALLHERLKNIETASALGSFIKSVAAVAGTTSISFDQLPDWETGTFTFDPREASQLAELLTLDPPTFVGKALEVSMRRPVR
jgi:hypothetical protein